MGRGPAAAASWIVRGDAAAPRPGTWTVRGESRRGAARVDGGRPQVGGCYDEIFDAVGPGTEFIVTAQNGPSARMLADAARDYLARKPDRAAAFANVVGIDAAMFVKMSATDSRAATVLQPGARWVFGASAAPRGTTSAGRRRGLSTTTPPRPRRG